jgi:molybdate transport system ATP-binding protein
MDQEQRMTLLEFRCQLTYASGFRLDARFDMDQPVTAIFGPSGSGKTSILSVIAGLRRPDQGTIRLGGRLLEDQAARKHVAPEARRIGYVFQDHLLFPHLTVGRNLLYGWKRRPRGATAIDYGRVGEVLELKDLLDRYPHTLSGGQRQRVALGRALLSAPELLLLDEPLVSLDAPLKDRVLDYVEQVLKEWRIPTLFVTHDERDVKRLAQQAIFLEQGQVVQVGKVDEMFNSR